MVEHLLCRDAICAVRKGLACMCVFGVSKLLFVLGGGVKGVCAARGLGWCAWRSPREFESPPVLSYFPERIVFFLSEEERPAHREVGPKVGKLMTQQLKLKLVLFRYMLTRKSSGGENVRRTHQRHGWVLSGLPRWRSWSGRQRWVQQTSCCTGTQHKSYRASCTSQSLPGDRIEWCLIKYNKILLNLWMNWQPRLQHSDHGEWSPPCGEDLNYVFCIILRGAVFWYYFQCENKVVSGSTIMNAGYPSMLPYLMTLTTLF